MTDLPTSVRDELFGLPNRRRMQEAIDAALEHVRAGGEPSAVLLIDVDGLHEAGEEVAVAIAGRLAASLRAEDLVTRFGGDVLVVVAFDVPDEVAAHGVAARLARALDEPVELGDGPTCVAATIGVSLVRETDPSVGAVVARANASMYAAKNKANRDARGGLERPREGSRLALVQAAFERSTIEDFEVYYQPIADLRNGSVAAVEAILRWEHPDLGTIPAAEFLPIAKQQGQMVTLGRWTIEKACAQTIRWGAARNGLPMRTHVNVSSAQVADLAFCEDVMSALARHGAQGQQLAFELTEPTLTTAPASLLATLTEARIELTLDGVDAPVPTAEALAGMPIAMLKLDRSWTAHCYDGPPAILREIVSLADSLGVPAVAQGVETIDQLTMVRESGFALAEGYLFSRPQSGPAIEQHVYRERPFAALLAPRPAWLELRAGAGQSAS
ncbi:MAG: hypothetical protein QOJ35_2267 [Solirubrobacteraceae bacterium]|nr:hypothetical protein [Solirubrobacteraceae bacterium]